MGPNGSKMFPYGSNAVCDKYLHLYLRILGQILLFVFDPFCPAEYIFYSYSLFLFKPNIFVFVVAFFVNLNIYVFVLVNKKLNHTISIFSIITNQVQWILFYSIYVHYLSYFYCFHIYKPIIIFYLFIFCAIILVFVFIFANISLNNCIFINILPFLESKYIHICIRKKCQP